MMPTWMQGLNLCCNGFCIGLVMERMTTEGTNGFLVALLVVSVLCAVYWVSVMVIEGREVEDA